MQPWKPVRLSPPVLAAGVALALLAAPAWPALLPVVVIAASLGTCAFVLLRRDSRGLRLVLAVTAAWLVAGHAGAWLLRNRPLAGFAWVVCVLFLLPLPVVPWLYWLTFSDPESSQPSDPAPRTPDPRSVLPDPEPRAPNPEGGQHA